MSLAFHTLPDGARLACLSQGQGAPLVMVHGSLCDYRYWNAQDRALAHVLRCHAVSLPHYHPVPEQSVPFSWQGHALELAAFIDRECGGRAHLLGHSRGGAVALRLALDAPRRVLSLTLADPGGAVVDADETYDEAACTQRDGDEPDSAAARAQAARLVAEGDIDAGLARFVDAVSRPGTWRQSPEAFRAMARDNAGTLPLQLRDAPAYFDSAALRALHVPVLLIGGEKSPARFHATIERLHACLPDVRREVIAGASHGMNLAHPRAFNRLLMDFIQARSEPSDHRR